MKKTLIIIMFVFSYYNSYTQILDWWYDHNVQVNGDQNTGNSVVSYGNISNVQYKPGWILQDSFSDEFDSSYVDSLKWRKLWSGVHGDPPSPYPNFDTSIHERAYFKNGPENIYFRYDSVLNSNVIVLRAIQDSSVNFDLNFGWPQDYPIANTCFYNYKFTSAWLESVNLIKYGYFEIKCRFPRGRNFWGGLWLWNADNSNYSEIDIYENARIDYGMSGIKRIGSNIHQRPLSLPDNRTISLASLIDVLNDGNITEKYYTVGVNWEEDKIQLYKQQISSAY